MILTDQPSPTLRPPSFMLWAELYTFNERYFNEIRFEKSASIALALALDVALLRQIEI
jgi:hypothetical protein